MADGPSIQHDCSAWTVASAGVTIGDGRYEAPVEFLRSGGASAKVLS
jgi:hypothetical protein